ncbi:hypothetical protein P7B02_03265 [Caulobacter segnis]|uniref:hypothetical protein n=1 Tax=Caulobacter segnis TaxID=88688 RepID=UPI0024101840|nr:hypothetical protein [Caulobacter segnis]MDG2520550.1 hypothetical protein [Caulobacter segnis]
MPLEPIKITHRGQTWNGQWSMRGRALHIDSAYGSLTTDPRRRRPKLVAAEALTELVETWRRSTASPVRPTTDLAGRKSRKQGGPPAGG